MGSQKKGSEIGVSVFTRVQKNPVFEKAQPDGFWGLLGFGLNWGFRDFYLIEQC